MNRTRVLAGASALTLSAAAAVLVAGHSDAATANPDLAMTSGYVFAGVTSAQVGQQVPFGFTMKNLSTTSTASDISFTFTVTGSSGAVSYVCPLVSNHFDIFADSPACETGALGAGKVAQAGVIVALSRTGTVTVKACASNLTAPDPVTTNNCKTTKILVQ